MEKTPLGQKLKRETEELHRLADIAMRNGIPLILDEVFMEQNRKVDELVIIIQRELKLRKEKR